VGGGVAVRERAGHEYKRPAKQEHGERSADEHGVNLLRIRIRLKQSGAHRVAVGRERLCICFSVVEEAHPIPEARELPTRFTVGAWFSEWRAVHPTKFMA
jgi:hypothetical protein